MCGPYQEAGLRLGQRSMETTCISTKIFTAGNLGDGQDVRTPFARFVEEVVLGILSGELP